jgi:hypothetical protein
LILSLAIKVKAFWINVYNLQVIKGVVDKFPIASVETIPGFTVNICGRKQELTLDDIENVILRDLFFDPAIHCFVKCSKGAPL